MNNNDSFVSAKLGSSGKKGYISPKLYQYGDLRDITLQMSIDSLTEGGLGNTSIPGSKQP